MTKNVALFIFNRPKTTEKVVAAIRQAKPSKLLVVADGPRKDRPNEAEKCAVTRSIIDRVDWECEVLTNYSEINLGCKARVSSGLDWVFSHVEDAIILEDDCLPNDSFFLFCEELLDRYRHDERVMVISGNNFQYGYNYSDYSYYFSRYTFIWGWATWRRAWQHYDGDMKQWQKIRDEGWLASILEDRKTMNFWHRWLQEIYEGYDTWDCCWTLSCWLQNGLSIIPKVNLVSNIGFDENATHTTDLDNPRAFLAAEFMEFPLLHPPFILRNVRADIIAQTNVFTPHLITRIQRKLKRQFKRLFISKSS
jgi:hypothetical protein